MKKTKQTVTKLLAVVLILAFALSALPVSAATGGATVDMTPVVQFPGVPISLGGTVYTCATDLGQPKINSGSDTVLTAGTVITFDLYFEAGGTWYPVRVPELQGTPWELYTVQVDAASGAELLGEPVWKTYPDDGYGEKYYLEMVVKGGAAQAALDVTVTLTQPGAGAGGSDNIGAAYRIQGTVAAQEMCVADFILPSYTGPCLVGFTPAVASTSDFANMPAGSTICFPLAFLGGDGQWYAAYSHELQGDPADLFTVQQTITAGDNLFVCNGWKTWASGQWFLEYTVAGRTEATPVEITAQLTQPGIYRQSEAVTFTGTVLAAQLPSATLNLSGTEYDCLMNFGTPVTSTGGTDLKAGDTVCFPLLWVDGSGNWWTVCHGDLQGDPAELFTIPVTYAEGEGLLSEPVWKHDWDYNSYYLEYAVLEPAQDQALIFSAQLTQPEKFRLGSVQTFAGTVAAKQEESLSFSGASLVLADGISVNFKMNAGAYTEPYAVLTLGGVTNTVAGVYDAATDKYVFKLYNIRPDWMGDTITATLYATKDGQVTEGDTITYSVAQYCYNKLETNYKDAQAPDAFAQLLVDLLSYGAAAQTYTGHNTDALVTNALTDTWRSWITTDYTAAAPDTAMDTAIADPAVTIKSAALYLRENVRIRLSLQTALTDGLTVKVTDAAGTELFTVGADAFTANGAGYYVFLDGLNAQQMRQVIRVTVYSGDIAVSNTLTYSIRSYADTVIAKQPGTDLAELVKAMMLYGDAAAAYVN